jgi:hypothetical protein
MLTKVAVGDPWRDATVSAEGLHVASIPQQPVALSDGFHCSDLGTPTGQVDPTIGAVQHAALTAMRAWLLTWKPPGRPCTRDHATISLYGGIQPTISQNLSKPINAFFKDQGTF